MPAGSFEIIEKIAGSPSPFTDTGCTGCSKRSLVETLPQCKCAPPLPRCQGGSQLRQAACCCQRAAAGTGPGEGRRLPEHAWSPRRLAATGAGPSLEGGGWARRWRPWATNTTCASRSSAATARPKSAPDTTNACVVMQVLVRRGEPIPERSGPIIVATRNDDLDAVIEATPSGRRSGAPRGSPTALAHCPGPPNSRRARPADLVFIQNGMLQPFLDRRGLGDNTQVVAPPAPRRAPLRSAQVALQGRALTPTSPRPRCWCTLRSPSAATRPWTAA